LENDTIKYDLLLSKGFRRIENHSSQFFGDYFYIYSNGGISIRIVSSQSLITVDVASNLDLNSWFDLALIIALIQNEQDLTKVITVNQFNVFLEKYLFKICDFFNSQNFNTTIKKIELLEKKRVKQMFPNM
jgi:hypothetical protein